MDSELLWITSIRAKHQKNTESETWNDFVHTCEHLRLPYPVVKRRKMVLCQPKKEVCAILSPNKDGTVSVVLKKEEMVDSSNTMDVPVTDERDEQEVRQRLENLAEQKDTGNLHEKESVFELKGGVKVTVQKIPNITERDSSSTALSKSGLKQQNQKYNNYGKCLKEQVNCCGRVLIELDRERATTCEKILYTCTDCKKTYSAVGRVVPEMKNKGTQTRWLRTLPARKVEVIDGSILDATNFGAEVEVCVPMTEAGNVNLTVSHEHAAEANSHDMMVASSDPSDQLSRFDGAEELQTVLEGGDIQHPMQENRSLRCVDRVSGSYSCDWCGGHYRTKYGLRRHKELHCGKTRSAVQCLSCNKILFCVSSFPRHARMIHPGEDVEMVHIGPQCRKIWR